MRRINNKSNLPYMELFGIIMSFIVIVSLFIIISDFFSSPNNIDIAKSNVNSIYNFINNNYNLNENGYRCYNYLNLQNLEFVQNFDDKIFYIYIIKKDGIYLYDNELYFKFKEIFNTYSNGYDHGFQSMQTIDQKIYNERINNFEKYLLNKDYIYKIDFNFNLDLYYEFYPNDKDYFSNNINFEDIFQKSDYLILIPNNIEGTSFLSYKDINKNKNKNSFLIISLSKLKKDKILFFKDYNKYDISKLVISNKKELIGIFSYDSLNYIDKNLCIFKDIINNQLEFKNIKSYEDSFKRDYLYININSDENIVEKFKLFINDNDDLNCQILYSNLFNNDKEKYFFNVYLNINEGLNNYFKLSFDKNLNLIQVFKSEKLDFGDFGNIIKEKYEPFSKIEFNDVIHDKLNTYLNINNFFDFLNLFKNINNKDMRIKFETDINCENFNFLKNSDFCNKNFKLNDNADYYDFLNSYNKVENILNNYNKCEIFKTYINKNNFYEEEEINNFIKNNFLLNGFYNINLEIKNEEKNFFDFKDSIYDKTNLMFSYECNGYYLLDVANNFFDSEEPFCNKYYILEKNNLDFNSEKLKNIEFFIFDNKEKKILFYDSDLNDFVSVNNNKILRISDNEVLLKDKKYDINFKKLDIKIKYFNDEFNVYYFIGNYKNNDFLIILTEDQFKNLKEAPFDYYNKK
jgi:hypothetical protein